MGTDLSMFDITGRNHIILNLSRKILDARERLSLSATIGRAILAQSAWNIEDFRVHHDLIVPPVLGLSLIHI